MNLIHLIFFLAVFVFGWFVRNKFGPWPLSGEVAASFGTGLDPEETEILTMFRESRQAEEKAAAEKRKKEFREKVIGKIAQPPSQ